MDAAAHDHGEETEVGLIHDFDEEQDQLLDPRDGQQQHGLERADGLFHPGRGQLIDSLRQVMRHGHHGTSHGLDAGTGRQGFALGGSHVGLHARHRYEDARQNEQE